MVEAFTYDSLDRLLTEQQQVAGGTNRTVTKGYDLAGNLTTMSYPSGLALTYTVDALNRIATIQQGATTIVTYRDVGARPYDRTLDNGIVQRWGFDTGRRLNDVLSTEGGYNAFAPGSWPRGPTLGCSRGPQMQECRVDPLKGDFGLRSGIERGAAR